MSPIDTRAFDALLTELKAAIRTCPQNASGGNKTRYFARQYMGLKNDEYKRIIAWFKDPSSMTTNDLDAANRALEPFRKSGTRAPRAPVPRSETVAKSAGPMVGPLADLIKAMMPLARVVASKAYSAEERNRLRELTGKGVIFEASNLLSSLCSETALGLNSAKNK